MTPRYSKRAFVSKAKEIETELLKRNPKDIMSFYHDHRVNFQEKIESHFKMHDLHSNNSAYPKKFDRFVNDLAEWEENRLEILYKGFPELENSKTTVQDITDNFTKNLSNIATILQSNQNQSNITRDVYKTLLSMSFLQTFSSMETYFRDVFLILLKNNPYARELFLQNHVRKKKIAEPLELDKEPEETITELVLGQSLNWNNFQAINGNFKRILKIDLVLKGKLESKLSNSNFDDDDYDFKAEKDKRNDIAHRMGKDKKGIDVRPDIAETLNFIFKVKKIVDIVPARLIEQGINSDLIGLPLPKKTQKQYLQATLP